MKHPVSNPPPRRVAAKKGPVRLNLRRRPAPEPDDQLGSRRKSSFWKWVVFVAFLHLIAILSFTLIYRAAPAPVPPPDQFMSLLPPGDVVHGTPGTQAAPKVAPTTSAPSVHHTSPPPKPAPPAPVKPVTPPPTPKTALQPPPEPTPKPVAPKPIIKPEAPPIAEVKPTPPPKPAAPKPPKVKVDLTLADGPPVPTVNKFAIKPKPSHVKKPTEQPADQTAPDRDAASTPDNTGLSKEQVAAKLGEKLENAGVANSIKNGASGAANSHPNSFADFYAAIRDQVMSKWTSPNLTDETAVNPIVEIHVERDGRVPPESVRLIQSSGNPTYDDSAIEAAKSLGYLYQPLPDGCPPDIPITFKLTR